MKQLLVWLVVATMFGCEPMPSMMIDPRMYTADSDSDTIRDFREGRGAPNGDVDTDGDTVADWLDVDSDDDGIDDAIEARVDVDGAPADADGDGLPDFRDTDSDGDGIDDDHWPGSLDEDGDGLLDAADLDDDGDGIADRTEGTLDGDRDSLPDYRDADSDGDWIGDRDEGGGIDWDADGAADRVDLDSDDDGLTDQIEAGDEDLGSAPLDTDHDGIADYHDLDSDGDGLLDGEERASGTDPRLADTDRDGFDDLVERVACESAECAMDAVDPTRSPATRGVSVVLAPSGAAPTPAQLDLEIPLAVQRADVYLLHDATQYCYDPPVGSGATDPYGLNLQLATLAAPQLTTWASVVPDLRAGSGAFRTYFQNAITLGDLSPNSPYEHFVDPDVDRTLIGAGPEVHSCSTEPGNALVPALWATMTGGALIGGLSPSDLSRHEAEPCVEGRSGWPCLRDDALVVLITATDGLPMNGPDDLFALPYDDALIGGHAPTFDEAVTVMRERGARIISVATGARAQPYLEELARATDSVDSSGIPLVTTIPTGMSASAARTRIRTAIASSFGALVAGLHTDVSLEWVSDPSSPIDTSTLVESIEAIRGDGASCAALETFDRDSDGIADGWRSAAMGANVCLRVHLRAHEGSSRSGLARGAVIARGAGGYEVGRRSIVFVLPSP